MGPMALKQYRNSIILVQSQLKTALLPFVLRVVGIPPSKFVTELDLIKAETLVVILKLLN